jgi:hypothetical protein
VRVDVWFAIAAAFSSVPPWKLWFPSLVAMPAAAGRRRIIA